MNKFKQNNKKPTAVGGVKSKSKKDFNKQFDRSDVRASDKLGDSKFSGNTNDWSWYALNEQMAKDVANIPFNTIPGVKVDLWRGDAVPETTNPYFGAVRMPAVCAITYVPGPGSSWDGTSGVNMAARQLYTAIRQKNSGAKNYEAPDLMMYLLSMESIYLQYFELRRILGLAKTYYFANRNMPDVLLNAAGVAGDEVRANFANFRARLNLLRERINSMAIPSGFTSFKRRALVASNVFMDSDSLRSNSYILTSAGYYKFNPIKYDTGGCCEWFPLSLTNTFADRLDKLDECITTVLTDDDMNVMSGDIVKAFGENGLYVLPDTPPDFVVNPAFDSNVLSQIENLRSFNISMATDVLPEAPLDVYQDNNVLYWRPYAEGIAMADTTPVFNDKLIANVFASEYAFVINSHINNPQAMDVLEWTRLAAAAADRKMVPDMATPYFPISCGLELVSALTILTTTDTANGFASEAKTISQFKFQTGLGAMAALMQFDWHPMVVEGNIGGTGTLANRFAMFSGPGMDLKVYTIVDRDTIARMHETANYCVYYLR